MALTRTPYSLFGGDGSGVQAVCFVEWELMTESNWFWSKFRLGARCRSVRNLARCRFHRVRLGTTRYGLIIATAAFVCVSRHIITVVATVNIDNGVRESKHMISHS